MNDFSVRFGYTEPAIDLRDSEMPETMRSGIWEVLRGTYFNQVLSKNSTIGGVFDQDFKRYCNAIWFEYFRKSSDDVPSDPKKALNSIRDYISYGEFFQVYNFLEFVARSRLTNRGSAYEKRHLAFIRGINYVLKRERAAFRFADDILVKVSDDESLSAIAAARSQSESNGVREHIKSAAELYSDRNPNYRNSIKESISAVESAVFYMTGSKSHSLQKPLRQIAQDHDLHPALVSGLEKLYAFTSDEEGVRHAMLEKPSVTQNDARFMLATCAAFSNYLLGLKAGD